MIITEKTRLSEVEHLLNKENIEELLKNPEIKTLEPLKFIDFFNVSIKRFDWLLDHQDAYVKWLRFSERKLIRFLGRLKGFKNYMKTIEDFIKSYHIDQSKEEKQAMKGVRFPDFTNQMLIDVIEFYNLHSVKQASRMKIKEWMLAAQSRMSRSKFQSELARIREKEMKKNMKNK